MNRKTAESGIMLMEGIYNPSIVSIFEKEQNNLKPFIVLNIENTTFLIANKKNFLGIVSKYKDKIKKIGIEKGWIILYIEKKMIKYEIIPTDLKIKQI